MRFLNNDPINDPIKSITLIERAIVNIIKEHPSYSRSEIAQQLKVSEATIKRAIQKLINIIFITSITQPYEKDFIYFMLRSSTI